MNIIAICIEVTNLMSKTSHLYRLTKRSYTRCNSWSSSNGVYSVNTQPPNKLGIHTVTVSKPRQRMCSCSSQTDLEDVVPLANTPPAQQFVTISPLAPNNRSTSNQQR